MLLLCKSLRKFPKDTWPNEKLNFKAIIFIQQLASRMSTMTSMSTNYTRATVASNCAFVSHLSNISLKVVGVVVDMLDPVNKILKVQILFSKSATIKKNLPPFNKKNLPPAVRKIDRVMSLSGSCPIALLLLMSKQSQ